MVNKRLVAGPCVAKNEPLMQRPERLARMVSREAGDIPCKFKQRFLWKVPVVLPFCVSCAV